MPQQVCGLCGGALASSQSGDLELWVCAACGPAAELASRRAESSPSGRKFSALAVVLSPLFAGPSFVLMGGSDVFSLFALYTPFALLACLLGGLPLHLQLARRGRTNAASYTLGGAVLALTTAVVVMRSIHPWLLSFALPGVTCGLVFWFVAVRLPARLHQRSAAE